MTIAPSVADVLRNHVLLEYEAIDRMYLNVYVPHLQRSAGYAGKKQEVKVHHDEGVANGVANKSVGSEGCESSHHQLPGLGG